MSKSTPEQIIRTSLRLFNRDGVRNTTIRAIAAEMGISPGNLTYHFPAQGALLEAILDEMTTQRDRKIGEIIDLGPKLDIRGYYDLIVDFTAYQHRYRFFYRDILDVFRIVPEAKKDYRRRFQERIKQGRKMCLLLVENGLLIAEPRPGQYSILSETVSSLSLARPTRSEALGRRTKSRDFAFFLLSLYVPYLTGRGLSQFNTIAALTHDSR